jgi:hypothetical protein
MREKERERECVCVCVFPSGTGFAGSHSTLYLFEILVKIFDAPLLHLKKLKTVRLILTMVDLIRMSINLSNRHIYDVVSVLYDVTMIFTRENFYIKAEAHVFLFFIFILHVTILFSFSLIACYGHVAQ